MPATFVIDLEAQDFKTAFLQFLNFFLDKTSELDFPQRNGVYFYKDLLNFKKKPEFYCGANLWLLKPAGRNRGNGIFLFNDLVKLNDFLQNIGEKKHKEIPKKPLVQEILANGYTHFEYKGNQEIKKNEMKEKIIKASKKFVIQKYMENPLLIKGRKFDIRAWVLVDHKRNIFLFREGYIRTSSEKFDRNSLDNYYVHLTNNAVQKHSKNYQKFELGNQLSYNNFQVFL